MRASTSKSPDRLGRNIHWDVGSDVGRWLGFAELVMLALPGQMAPQTSDPPVVFRGDSRHSGVYSTSPSPAEGSAGVCWRVTTAGTVRSSPAVTADAVFVGSGDGVLYALARFDGAVRWRFNTGSAVQGSPAVDRGTVFVSAMNGAVYAVGTADGKLRWKHESSPAVPLPWGREGWDYFASSPMLAAGVLYVGSPDGNLYALDERNGHQRWRAAIGAQIWSSPAVADGMVYVGATDGRLYAVDQSTGRIRWRFDTEGVGLNSSEWKFDRRSIQSSPTIGDGAVFFGSRDAHLYAVDATTGTLRWRVSYDNYSWVIGTPAFHDGVLYVSTSDAHIIQALDARTGQERWRFDTHTEAFPSPTLAEGTLYVGTNESELLALDASTGTERWRMRVDGHIQSSASVRDGFIYFGSDGGSIYALRTGQAAPVTRAVFWDTTLVSQSQVWGGMMLREYLNASGYQILDAAALAHVMTQRVADHEPSVIVFAQDVLPATVGPVASDTVLFRRYMNSGGTVVWLGLPPLGVDRDSTGAAAAFVPERAAALLGVSFSAAAGGIYSAVPTAAGRKWGLTGSRVSTFGIDTAQASTVLAIDDLGRAAAWIRSYGGRPGSGFVQLWTQDVVRDAFRQIRQVAEHGLFEATRPTACGGVPT